MRFNIVKAALLVIVILTISCAKRGNPTGGKKDELPPVLITVSPKDKSVNFSNTKIKILFNEYVKVKDLDKNFIISPPLKYKPVITPVGAASKKITLKILDTLPSNTTYSINFGESIVDNNEENKLDEFIYTFSTGNSIDSLKFNGSIGYSFDSSVSETLKVFVYNKQDYYDSIVFKENPSYVSRVKNGRFSVSNLKKGIYKLIVLEDKNSNFKLDPKIERIGFSAEFYELPKDTAQIKLILSRPKLPFKLLKITEKSKGKLIVPYQGKLIDSFTISSPEIQPLKWKKIEDKDSLYVFLKSTALDSINIKFDSRAISETVKIYLRKKKLDSLKIENQKENAFYYQKFIDLKSNNPIEAIDTTKLKITMNDSISIENFSTRIMDNRLRIEFGKKQQSRYEIMMYPGALKDYFEQTNDSLRFRFRTNTEEDLGSLEIKITNKKNYDLIIELINENKSIKSYVFSKSKTFTFNHLIPGEYYFKILHDTNNNKSWDAGEITRNSQPEKVEISPTYSVKANWDLKEVINIE